MAYHQAAGGLPAVAMSMHGLQYFEHWRCPHGCGYRFMTTQPFDNGDADSAAATHVCK